MGSSRRVTAIELDRTRLLGFDQVPKSVADTTLMAKVGSKPLDATKAAQLATLTKVGFKDVLRR